LGVAEVYMQISVARIASPRRFESGVPQDQGPVCGDFGGSRGGEICTVLGTLGEVRRMRLVSEKGILGG